MEKLEEIMEMWKKDAVIDLTDPSREILHVPVLHSKYLGFMTRHRIAERKAAAEYSKMKKVKWEYYSGKMSKEQLEQYGWEQFPFTLKSDITTYLESDDDLIKLINKKVYYEETAKYCEYVLKELNQRTWQLKEHLQHERFIHGAR